MSKTPRRAAAENEPYQRPSALGFKATVAGCFGFDRMGGNNGINNGSFYVNGTHLKSSRRPCKAIECACGTTTGRKLHPIISLTPGTQESAEASGLTGRPWHENAVIGIEKSAWQSGI
jgi:hypothetical protein